MAACVAPSCIHGLCRSDGGIGAVQDTKVQSAAVHKRGGKGLKGRKKWYIWWVVVQQLSEGQKCEYTTKTT
jgi:hypothetical protein